MKLKEIGCVISMHFLLPAALYAQDAVADGHQQKGVKRLGVHPAIVEVERGVDAGHQTGHQADAPAKEIARKEIDQYAGASSQTAEEETVVDVRAPKDQRKRGNQPGPERRTIDRRNVRMQAEAVFVDEIERDGLIRGRIIFGIIRVGDGHIIQHAHEQSQTKKEKSR